MEKRDRAGEIPLWPVLILGLLLVFVLGRASARLAATGQSPLALPGTSPQRSPLASPLLAPPPPAPPPTPLPTIAPATLEALRRIRPTATLPSPPAISWLGGSARGWRTLSLLFLAAGVGLGMLSWWMRGRHP